LAPNFPPEQYSLAFDDVAATKELSLKLKDKKKSLNQKSDCHALIACVSVPFAVEAIVDLSTFLDSTIQYLASP